MAGKQIKRSGLDELFEEIALQAEEQGMTERLEAEQRGGLLEGLMSSERTYAMATRLLNLLEADREAKDIAEEAC